MASPEALAIKAEERENARIEQLASIDTRLSRIEEKLGISAAPPPVEQDATPPAVSGPVAAVKLPKAKAE